MSYTVLFMMKGKFIKDSFVFFCSVKIMRSNRVKNSIFVTYLNCVHCYLIIGKFQMMYSDLLLEEYIFLQ